VLPGSCFTRCVAASPPRSFHNQYTHDWALWVLEHGLPELPTVLDDDDEVPIAYWAGLRCASVIFRSWWEPLVDDFPEGWSLPLGREVNTEHYSYRRSSRGWVATGSTGGEAGPIGDPLAPASVQPRDAHVGGGFVEGGIDGGVAGVVGIAGGEANLIELKVDGEAPMRRSLQAPLRWFVVCFEPSDSGTLRVLDGQDRPLFEQAFFPGRLPTSPPPRP
jgi:hypothetical protein